MGTRRKVVSRHGLTRCPHCETFVRDEDVECVGCGGALDATILPSERPLLGALRRGFARTRGGLIAASLLGLSTVVGCDDRSVSTDGGDARAQDARVDTSNDIPALPPYGIPPRPDSTVDAGFDGEGADASDDLAVQPPYGIPPPPDGGPQPLYGASPAPWDDKPKDDE